MLAIAKRSVLNILLMDDEKLILRALSRAFSDRGHQVFQASSSKDGLALYREHTFDVLLLDILMPEMSGPEMLKKITPTSASVVFISACVGEYNLGVVKSMGADLFIEKPFEDIFLVVEEIENLVKEKRQSFGDKI